MDKYKEKDISIKVSGKDKVINEKKSVSEHDENEFPWILPEKREDQRAEKVVHFEKYHKPSKVNKYNQKLIKRPIAPSRKISLQLNSSSIRKAVITAIAVLVGLGFGIAVLTFVTDVPFINQTKVQAPVQVEAEHEAVPVQTNTTERVALTERQFYVIQGGAFSTKESAEQLASQFKAQGQPAVVFSHVSPILLFVGLGKDEYDAKVIGSQLQDSGLEIYVKPYAVQGYEFDGEAPITQTEASAINELFDKLISTTSNEDSFLLTSQSKDQLNSLIEQIRPLEQQLSFIPSLIDVTNQLSEVDGNTNQFANFQASLLDSIAKYERWIIEQKALNI
ncbi:SPOR domain-containing protein [Bacillus solimangrovi]|uniref:SPOR domain-containing protein n=1 Tax=Bacillus solimangrovi TaxID=1305675 RepID=A0A1E5LBK1_9BACI|nr:SPOR domain-containing protein [Bacillus solimangrovi]OEH91460.1 hypothetical protein BFG57_04920 [Bacillus solimangrovi]